MNCAVTIIFAINVDVVSQLVNGCMKRIVVY